MPARRTLVIPMHQESARIETTLDELAASWSVLGDCELVLVDDGSTDGTADLAERSCERHRLPARIVRREHNGGKGAAVASGVAAALGEVVAFTDADLSTGAEPIRQCFEIVEADDADVVVSSRTLPDSAVAVRPPL